MPGAWKTARVFISSTFRDMHAERDHLVTDILPRLRENLEKHRIYLDDIDLRWGVTEEQTRSRLALEVCLQAIDECRPFFLGILGQRYGSAVTNVPKDSFARHAWLSDYAGRSLTELEIIHAVLREPHRKVRACFYFRDPAALNDVPEARRKSDFVETNPEAIKKLAELQERIRASGCPLFKNYPAKWDVNALDRSTRTMGRFTCLTEFGERVYQDLWNAIRAEFELADEPAAAASDPFIEEHDGHERWMESLLRVYVPRKELNEELIAFARDDDPSVCVVSGPEGCGKSAALAAFIQDLRARFPQIPAIVHFAGATPNSSQLARMKERLCREILSTVLEEQRQARIAGVAVGEMAAERQADIDKEYAIPGGPTELTATLRRFILKIPAGRRVVIVLDALDRVQGTRLGGCLDWVPEPLPANVRIIANCNEFNGEELAGHRACRHVAIPPLSRAMQEEIVRRVPLLWAKALDEKQIKALLDNPACANALFLRVAIEELHGYGSFEQLTRRILEFPGRPPVFWEKLRLRKAASEEGLAGKNPTEALFDQVLSRLEASFDKDAVRAMLAYLFTARRGLLERELRGLVAGAEDMPAILRQLRPHLANSAGLLNFNHISLRQAVQSRCLDSKTAAEEASSRLADYFMDQPYLDSDGQANRRKLDELPWQLRRARRPHDLQSLLLTLEFCERKTGAGMVKELTEDFASALESLSDDPIDSEGQHEAGEPAANRSASIRPVLTLLEEAIRREIAFLTRNPGAFFQCIWNQGWWHDCAPAASYYQPPGNGWGPEGAPWDAPAHAKLSILLEQWRGAKEQQTPGFYWLRTLRPLPRRLGTAERTILHGGPLSALAPAPEGAWLATAGENSVKLWDTETCEECHAFEVGRKLPDSNAILYKIFEKEHGTDAESAQELAWLEEGLEAGEEKAGCLAWSPDGRTLLAGAGQTFYLFDPGLGTLRLRFTVPTGKACILGLIPCAAFSPDGKCIALAGAESPCALVVEAHSGKTLLELAGHCSVNRVSFSQDGSQLVTAGAEPEVEQPPAISRIFIGAYAGGTHRVASFAPAFWMRSSHSTLNSGIGFCLPPRPNWSSSMCSPAKRF
jgi:hypothetical protein